MKKNNAFFLLVVILAALAIRLYNINGALFDFHPLRQALNAAVARNYATLPGAMFLLPQADNMGASPGYLMFEFPILPYAVSFLIRIFGVENWLFRLPSVIFFLVSAVYFFRISERTIGPRTSRIALILYCTVPMTILMSRVFQSESFMLMALMITLYYFIRWLEEGRLRDLCVYTAGFTLFVLLKITNLYILLFLVMLLVSNKNMSRVPRFVLSLVLVLTINFWWWLVYSAEIRSMFPCNYTVSQEGVAVFSLRHISNIIREYSLSGAYWALTAKQCLWMVFSPLVAVFSILGVIAVIRERGNRVFLLGWTLSVFVFLFMVPSAALQDYYKIHLVPPGVMLAAVFYMRLFDRKNRGALAIWGKAVFWTLFAASVFLAVYPVIRYKPVFENQLPLGQKVESITDKDDLIVAAFGSDAMLLFYCNRRGWSPGLYMGKDNISMLEGCRRQGAEYFVSGNLDEFYHDGEFSDYMYNNYILVSREEQRSSGDLEGLLDRLILRALSLTDIPYVVDMRRRMEKESLGHVIFDIRERIDPGVS